jgi:hypothetical protein
MQIPGGFAAEMSFREALDLYIFLRAREEELSAGAERLYEALRSFLYERLSIEEMEKPEELLSRINPPLYGDR